MAQLQSGALSCFHQVYVIRFFVLLVIVVVFLLAWIHHVDLVQLLRVDVGVEVSHDGEDDEDAQQQAGEQQELLPLGQQILVSVQTVQAEVHCWGSPLSQK